MGAVRLQPKVLRAWKALRPDGAALALGPILRDSHQIPSRGPVFFYGHDCGPRRQKEKLGYGPAIPTLLFLVSAQIQRTNRQIGPSPSTPATVDTGWAPANKPNPWGSLGKQRVLGEKHDGARGRALAGKCTCHPTSGGRGKRGRNISVPGPPSAQHRCVCRRVRRGSQYNTVLG